MARIEDPWSDSAVDLRVTAASDRYGMCSYTCTRQPDPDPASGVEWDFHRFDPLDEAPHFTKKHASILDQRLRGELEPCGVDGHYTGLSTAQSAVIEILVSYPDRVSIDLQEYFQQLIL